MMSLSRFRNRLGVRLLIGLTAGLILLTVSATIVWLGPLPPRVVVMSTGAPGSDYAVVIEPGGTAAHGAGAALRRLEERANHLRVPAALAPELYTLRAHIAMVQRRTM